MYMMDDEGFRSRGGGMFSNIFRMHGGWVVQLDSVGMIGWSVGTVAVQLEE